MPILLLTALLVLAFPVSLGAASAAPPAAAPSHEAPLAPAATGLPTALPAALGGGALGPTTKCAFVGIWTNITYNTTTGCGRLTVAPSPRDLFAMANDPVHNITLLFGGGPKTYATLNDTWEYANGVWTEDKNAGPAPSPRMGEAMDYDAADGYFVLWGGFYHPASGVGHYDNDTFTFNDQTGKWTNITATVGKAPTGRYFPTIAYDKVDKELVLFGGGLEGLPNGASAKPINETWVFKGGAWTNLTTSLIGHPVPEARDQAVEAWDGSDNQILLFGGQHASGKTLNSTWAFVRGAWKNVSGSLLPPPDRSGMMAEDVADGGYDVYFGGFNSTGLDYDNQTWIFSHDNWTDITPWVGQSPPFSLYGGVEWGGLVWDNGTQQVLFFGGYGLQGPFGSNQLSNNATWTYRWTNLTVLLSVNRTQIPVDQGVQLSVVTRGGWWDNYSWKYNGLPTGCTTSNVTVLTCVPTALGKFNVSVIATDANGTKGTSNNFTLNVYRPLTPTLSVYPQAIDLGHFTYFNTSYLGGSNGSHTYQYWGHPFPAGCSSANSPSDTCRPSATGMFNISVNVTDSVGDKAFSGPLPLTVFPKLTVAAVGGPYLAGSKNPVTLDAGHTLWLNATPAGGDALYTYTWSGLPAGCTPADVQNYSCVPSPAAYQGLTHLVVTLTLTDRTNSSVNTTVKVTIWPELNAGVNVAPLTGPSPLTVSFFGNVTGGAVPLLITWFLNGTVGLQNPSPSQLNFTQSYPKGNYTVEFWANDTLGYSYNATFTIMVGAAIPPLAGTLNETPAGGKAEVGQAVTFSANASGGLPPYTYNWTPAAGCTANGNLFQCAPTTPGTLFGQVEILDSRGVKHSLAPLSVEIFPAVHIAATYALANSCGVSNATLTATITGGHGPFATTWTFPGGTTSTLNPVTYGFSAIGNNTVKVSVVDSLGGVANTSVGVLLIKCGGGTTGASNSSSLPVLDIGLLVIVALIVIVVAAVLLRRRGGGAPPAEGDENGELPPEEETMASDTSDVSGASEAPPATGGEDEFVWGSDQAPAEETAAMETEGSGYAPPPGPPREP